MSGVKKLKILTEARYNELIRRGGQENPVAPSVVTPTPEVPTDGLAPARASPDTAEILQLIPDKYRKSAQRFLQRLSVKAPELTWNTTGALSLNGEKLSIDLLTLLYTVSVPYTGEIADKEIIDLLRQKEIEGILIRNQRVKAQISSTTSTTKNAAEKEHPHWEKFRSRKSLGST
jgi:hypothetical protein